MDAARTNTFQDARRFERDLNPRQREVLALMAAGKTNAEIAEALDLSFYGAKWNVSEILSKLGLSSREEAADYWRWRQSARTRMSEVVRALVPAAMPAKLATSAAAVALVGVFLALAILALRTESSDVTGFRPVRMASVSRDYRDGPVVSSMSWEWKNSTTYRVEYAVAATADREALTGTLVADGTYRWGTSTNEDIYYRDDLDRTPPHRLRNGQDFANPFVGPTYIRDVNALLEVLRRESDVFDPQTPRWAEVTGANVALGRPVTVIQFGPLNSDGTPERRASGEPVTSSGTGEIWVDESTMAILRFEVIPNSESGVTPAVVEATLFEPEPQLEDSTFEFEPPPGKQLVVNDARQRQHDPQSAP